MFHRVALAVPWLILFVVSGSARAVVIQDPGPGTWPGRVFAPYVDLTLWPTPRIDQIQVTTGAKYFNLAFLVASSDGSNSVRWGGYPTYPVTSSSTTNESWDFDYNVIASINAVRAAGGDVRVSFGGANGTPIDARITDHAALVAEYQRVINTYRLRSIDFDVEGYYLADAVSVARRSAAIKALQDANPNLSVWFTLPVLPTGLTADGVAVLTSALNAGARIDGVNVMAMDYGDGAAPNPSGKMGDYAIAAATATHAQLKTLLAQKGLNLTDQQVWSRIGLTPMIGINDVQTEVFDLQEAAEVLAFAKQKDLGFLSFWSATRDHPGAGVVGPYDSGIAQADYAFTNLFNEYNAPEPGGLLLVMAGMGVMSVRGRRGLGG